MNQKHIVFKIKEFADFTICHWTTLAIKKTDIGKGKMKIVWSYVASKVPLDKTHVPKNAKFWSIFKISFFSCREMETFSQKLAVLCAFFGSVIHLQSYLYRLVSIWPHAKMRFIFIWRSFRGKYHKWCQLLLKETISNRGHFQSTGRICLLLSPTNSSFKTVFISGVTS